jgi:sarcosine oxidase subunit alpha
MHEMRDDKTVFRPRRLTFTFDGQPVPAWEGESLSTALIAAGIWELRRSPSDTPRGPFCLMGICQECVVEIDGLRRNACLEPVRANLVARRAE